MGAGYRQYLLLCVCVAFLASPTGGFSQSAGDLGEAQGNSLLGVYGSKSGITNNISNPLTSSNTPMTTVDGSTSFSGQLQCPNSQKFMEVFIQPGATGDIDTFIVSQDTNFDGNLDYAFQVPFPVSGICANGVITCDPGAWTNCRTYQWTPDSSGRITLQAVALTALGGCFCINNSCGANLVFTNTSTIMNIIGGGVASAIQKKDTRYAISNVVIDGMDATYYGQNSGGCIASSSSPANAEQYYYNPGNISSDATTEAAVPSSLYTTLKTSEAAGNYQIATCTIARGDMIAWNMNYQCYMQSGISDGCTVLENNSNCQLQSETIDGVTTVNNYMVTGLEPLSSCQMLSSTVSASCEYSCPLGLGYPCTGPTPTCTDGSTVANCSYINPVENYGGSWSIGLTLSGSGSRLSFLESGVETGYIQFAPGIQVWGSADTYDPNFYRENPMFGWIQVVSSGPGPGYDSSITLYNRYGAYSGTVYFKGVVVSSSGTCGSFGTVSVTADSSWNLSACWTVYDGYVSYGNGLMNFSPNQCPISGGSACVGAPSFCSKSCTQNDCEPWWTKTRTYTCTTSGYDFSGIRKRVSTITQSAQDDTSSMSYNDYYLSGSTWVTGSSTYPTNNVYRGNIGSCQQACKTVMNVDNTSTNVASKKSDISLDTTTPVYYYHACTSAGCPVGTGETIVTDCRCIDDFTEAAVIMQTLRKGAQDIICSDGTEIGLQ